MRKLCAALILLAACGGGGGGGGDDTGDGDGGSGGPDANPPLAVCVLSCAGPADCATGNPGTILDADNYSCDDGRCVWLGCNSTTECTTTYSSADYVCEEAFDSGTPTCWPTCATVDDCILANPLYDADNYECSGGKCHWLGCNSTTECTDALHSADYRCHQRLGVTTPICWPTCTTAADCATTSAPYDADNYACDDGLCLYTGCNSTTECTALGADYVCN